MWDVRHPTQSEKYVPRLNKLKLSGRNAVKVKKLWVLFTLLGISFAGLAQNYEKQASNGRNDKSVPEAFTNTVSFLQACLIGGTISCQGTQSLGVRYTSGSANTELAGYYRCTYKGSTLTKAASPGYDLYYCGSGSALNGWTIFVLVEGDYSNSFAGTITGIYQP